MPLNISGSIVNASIADTLDYKSIVTRGLVSHLDSDSLDSYPGKDTVYDISTNTNNGTMYNGTALTFDGSDDWIEHTQITHPYNCTLMVWIKTSTANKTICSNSSGGPVSSNYNINSSGYLEFQYHDGTWRTIDSNPVAGIADGNWHHVVFARNGTNHKMYKDGELIDEGTLNSQKAGAVNAIGRNWSGYNFNGLMSDFRIYSTQLSATDISEIYNNPTTMLPGSITSSQLYQWWPLSEGSGTKAYDVSGNNRHGTFQNMAPTWVEGQTDNPQLAGKGHSQKMDFDGSNDYLLFGTTNLPTGNTNVTLSCWVWPTTSEDTGCFGYGSASTDTTFEIYMYNDSGTLKPAVHYAGGNGGTNLGLTLNQWNHIAATYDKTSTRTYVNGVLSVTDAQALSILTTYRHIGAHNYGSAAGFFDGQIDECAIWNTVLSIEDIKELAATDNPSTTATPNSVTIATIPNPPDARNIKGKNLVGYWRNDGYRWKDLSGSGNDAVSSGSPEKFRFPKGFSDNRDSQGFPTGPGSFQFNGGTDWINLGDSSGDFSTTVITISCWVRSASVVSGTILCDESGGGFAGLFLVYMAADGTILWRRGNSSNDEWGFISTNTTNDGNWHNVVCLDNGSAQSMYIDGVAETASSNPGTYSTAVASGRDVAIGVLSRDYTSGNFDGNIDSISLYSRTLSPSEVLHNFNVHRNRFGV